MPRSRRATGSSSLGSLAQQAARLIADGQASSYAGARRKLTQRLHLGRADALPTDLDIETALREHQRLFQSHSQPMALTLLRRAALDAMRAMAQFQPRLFGPVLDGTADQYSSVDMQLHCDEPEAVLRFLEEHGISARARAQRVWRALDQVIECPRFDFTQDEIAFRLTILPTQCLRQAPRSSRDEPLIARATAEDLDRLLDKAPATPQSAVAGR